MLFKVRLLLSAAAPLVFAFPAFAQTTISTATTTPVSTSTIANGSPGNLIISSSGSIAPAASTNNVTAVTVDSNNTVELSGQITFSKSDNVTGVLFKPNLTTGFKGSGTITLTDDYVRTDADLDGDLDGPLATGTGRYGIRVDPGGTFTGDIDATGTISIAGNDSAAISIQSALQGNLVAATGTTIVGSNALGLDVQKNVSGNLQISSSITAQGEGARAARILGDVGGEFMIDASIITTGFTSTSVSNYADASQLLPTDVPIASRRDADDLLVGGSALELRGSLAFGFLNNGPAVGGADPTPDVKDVVQNFNDNRLTGGISSFGSAPTIDIAPLSGAAGRNIVYGKVRESVPDVLDDDKDSNLDEIIGVFNYDYGFINRGTIASNGLNIGFASTGLRIAGSADGAYTTTIQGGVFNGGQISAASFEADAIAVDLGKGLITPQVVNTGSVTASVNTETTNSATAVLIRQGASVPTIVNQGFMSSTVRGWAGDAIGFRDLSGSVTSFTNSSRIAAGHADDDLSDLIVSGTGKSIGVDLSANTTGIVLTQSDTVDNARIFGDVLLGSGGDKFDLLSGLVLGNVDFGASGADRLNISSATLTGNAVFRGPTADVVLANAAKMTGALTFGGAAATLNLSGGSSYAGSITNSGAGSVAISLNNSSLTNTAPQALAVSSFAATNGSKIQVDVNNAFVATGQPAFIVAGNASLAADTRISPVFSQVQLNPLNVRLIQAGSLTVGGPVSAMLEGNAPFLYQLSLAQTGNNIDLSLRPKTSLELGLSAYQAGSYTAVLDLLKSQDTLGAAFTQITSQAPFLRAYNDILPPSDAALMQVLATNASAALGATGHRLDLLSDKPNAPGGAWLEEFGLYHSKDATISAPQTSGGGFGIAGGFDLISYRDKVFGAFFALDSAKLEEDGRTGAPLTATQTAIGAYGGWKFGKLALNGSAAYGFINFDDKRDFAVSSVTDKVSAKWKGNSIQAGGRATYEIPLGFVQVKPYVAADYMSLTQDSYKEKAQTYSSLALEVGDADSHIATASGGLQFAARLGAGSDFQIDPELSIGYKSVLSYKSNPAMARFTGQTTSFQFARGDKPDTALVAGLGFNMSSQFLNMKIGYDTEITDNSVTHYGSITLRMAFY